VVVNLELTIFFYDFLTKFGGVGIIRSQKKPDVKNHLTLFLPMKTAFSMIKQKQPYKYRMRKVSPNMVS
jgi:hypothetical protein